MATMVKSNNASGTGNACNVNLDNINNVIIEGRYEILCEILGRLPVKSLLRFTLVCKGWRSIIKQDKYFLNLQQTLSKNTPLRHNNMLLLISPAHPWHQEGKLSLLSMEDNLMHHERYCNDIATPFDGFMLKPIHGLICYPNYRSGSVLIYNPCTGEKTSWIQTTSAAKIPFEVDPDKDQYTWQCECKFGFGFHRATKEHKVVCYSETYRHVNEDDIINNDEVVEPIYEVKEVACEVLTVGSNTWRKIDEVLPHILTPEQVYVNGFIYWIGSFKSFDLSDLCIVGFDVGREKFNKVISLPPHLVDKCIPELVEVDGHVALLDRGVDQDITLWIHSDDDGSDGDNWIEETIPMPYLYSDERLHLAFEAINGTDLIILKPFRRKPELIECFYYYDRKKREYYMKRAGIPTTYTESSYPTLPWVGYNIVTFLPTLLPVQTSV